MRISDWSSDVCSSDLHDAVFHQPGEPIRQDVAGDAEGRLKLLEMPDSRKSAPQYEERPAFSHRFQCAGQRALLQILRQNMCHRLTRSEEHTSEIQSLTRTPSAVFCLKKKNNII